MRIASTIFLLALVGYSFQVVTPQELIKAVNIARTNPVYYADIINKMYTSKGIKGKRGDLNCYQEAEDFLRRQPKLPALKESIVADAASKHHSDYMQKTNTLSHTGENGSNIFSRLEMFGKYPSIDIGCNENIAYEPLSPPVDAEFFLLLWIIDYRVPSRGHRTNIFSTLVSEYGCGQGGIFVTCVGTKPINNTASPSHLAALNLNLEINGKGYTGV